METTCRYTPAVPIDITKSVTLYFQGAVDELSLD
jgi:hypothetical protein